MKPLIAMARMPLPRQLLAGLMLFSVMGVSSQLRADDAALQALSEQVADDLISKLDEQLGLAGQMKDRLAPKSMAVWPFDDAETPLPAGAGQAITRAMEKAMAERAGSRFRVITRTDLKALVDAATGLSSFQTIDRPVAVLADNAAIDMLAIGRVLPGPQGRLNLTYRLVSMSGEILSLSEPVALPEDMEAMGLRRRMLDMDAAWKQAAAKLSAALPELRMVQPGRLSDGETRLQGRFGPYFLGQVITDLEQAYINPISGFRLSLVKPGQEARDDVYRLSGRYWHLGAGLGLRLELRSASGDGASWSGVIAKASIPSGLLKPQQAGPGALDRDLIGAMGLSITTDRGADPIYALGEEMTLEVSVTQPGFLNCYYGQANGEVFKIFPNPYHTGSAIDGKTPLVIPGPEMPFAFVMSPPVGDEWVRCFAADRDPALALPQGLLANDLHPLPPRVSDRLVESYRALVGLSVSEASLVLSVVD